MVRDDAAPSTSTRIPACPREACREPLDVFQPHEGRPLDIWGYCWMCREWHPLRRDKAGGWSIVPADPAAASRAG